MNRRAFLRTLVAGVAGLSLVPWVRPVATVPLFVGENTYRDYRRCVIPQRKLMARIRISGDVIRESVNRPPGSFLAYCHAEHRRTMQEFAAELDRRGLDHAVQV